MPDHPLLSRIKFTSDLLRLSLDSPLGIIDLIATSTQLAGIMLHHAAKPIRSLLEQIPQGENLPLVSTQQFLSKYFYGPFSPYTYHIDYRSGKNQDSISLINSCPDIKSINLNMSIYTLNEISIYRSLINTNAGTTISYASLSRIAGIPRGARFVGTTMAKNIFPILIPCHRVIRSDGTLGRYSGGDGVKEFLLEHENNIIRQEGPQS